MVVQHVDRDRHRKLTDVVVRDSDGDVVSLRVHANGSMTVRVNREIGALRPEEVLVVLQELKRLRLIQ